MQLVIEQFIDRNSYQSTPLSLEEAKKYGIHEYCDRLVPDADEFINQKTAPQYMLKAPIASKETVRNLCNFLDDRIHSSAYRRKRKRMSNIEEESLKVFNKKGSIESASNFSTKAVESKKKNLIKEEVLN
jgi:hypothetical protein